MHTHKHVIESELNKDIKQFPQVHPVESDMVKEFDGISRMIMLDRYSFKDTEKLTLKEGDLVLLTIKEDALYPVRGIGVVKQIDKENDIATIQVSEEYISNIEEEHGGGIVTRLIATLDKPMELFYEQIAKRVSTGLVSVEKEKLQGDLSEEFYKELSAQNLVPAGRVLYGAGSETDVTFFNCYVMPFPKDSREGISEHRREVMEIMSRGGGVGTNGSTLRPRNTLARGVNGKSSGAVSWLNDLSQLTHLVQQGGSRRGAQMIMMSDSHPDILEFIISKMQSPDILRYIASTTNDAQIKELAQEKLDFIPLTKEEQETYEGIVSMSKVPGMDVFPKSVVDNANKKLVEGGTYNVVDPDALTGANISVAITDEFMKAVENDADWALRFPDVENYSEEEMKNYDEKWHEVGDVREWEELGYGVTTYRHVKAKDLWELINTCATYAAEPGIFYIDRANDDTNAKAYGQKVVATNPCGEQPLAPYSVCNLAAINLAEMVDKDKKEVDYGKLKQTVRTAVRLQDNVIDATPYFLEDNKVQALGERRLGLGVMALADLLIYSGHRYGSKSGNKVVKKVFKTIAITAYEQSIEIAKEKGSFPFLVGETDEETQKLREQFIKTGYMKKMPEHVREGVLKYGIRNSHLLTVAPTGSTGTMVGVGTGLEPYFAFKYYRSGRLGRFIEMNSAIVQEYLDRHPEVDENNLPPEFVSAMELSPLEHVSVQSAVQYWVDSSISKTVNAPAGYTVSQVAEVYEELYRGGAKGGTVYVDGSRNSQVLNLLNEDEEEKKEKVSDVKEVVEQHEAVEVTDTEFSKRNEEDVVYGTDVGDTCPVCRNGIVEIIAGCTTCTNCSAQLACGI